ncbi:hypothetical protein RIVM261_013050 [Rivularia sp. IAM M-261]|nr:hypothetical protein RIVM261_013050 [Rivularia sp. IAM M-261]
MEIKTITVKKVRNLGNYQTLTAEATAHLNEGENPAGAMQELILFVHDGVYLFSETSQNTEKPAQKKPTQEGDFEDSDKPTPVPVVKIEPLPKEDKDGDGIPF